MSISTSIPQAAGRRRSHHLLAAITAIALAVALAAWAVSTYTLDSGPRSAHPSAPTQASLLRDLTPAGREYVLGVTSMTPVEVSAAFGTSLTSVQGRRGDRGAQAMGSSAPTLAAILRSLPARERRYVLGIAALTPLQLWGAFGTTPTPPVLRGGARNTTASSAITSS
jgi:hypothetical protein